MINEIEFSARSHEVLATLRRTIFFISMPVFILNLMLPVDGKQIGASVVEIGLFFSAFSKVQISVLAL